VYSSALRCLANLLTSDQGDIPKQCLEYDLLTQLDQFSKHHNNNEITKEVMWMLSNLISNEEYIPDLLNHPICNLVV